MQLSKLSDLHFILAVNATFAKDTQKMHNKTFVKGFIFTLMKLISKNLIKNLFDKTLFIQGKM